MTVEPVDNNLESESTEPDAEDSSPAEIMPPPLPTTGYETQVLEPETDEASVEEEATVVITAPPVVTEPEPAKELDMPSPFEQEQPDPITVDTPIEVEVIGTPPDAPLPPPAAPPSGEAPKKNNTTLIIIIVVVAVILLCCCCAIVIFGASMWEDIAWELGLNLIQSFMPMLR